MATHEKPPTKRKGGDHPTAKRRSGGVKSALKQSGKAAAGVTPAVAGLGNIRSNIDAIDARIHALLNERARFAQLVGVS